MKLFILNVIAGTKKKCGNIHELRRVVYRVAAQLKNNNNVFRVAVLPKLKY